MKAILQKPLLGIAIPAFKREVLLGQLIESIDYALPIVVSDNGGHLSMAFKARYLHVVFLKGDEVDVLANWNRAASALNTEWIVMPGDDDLYYPDSFVAIIERLQNLQSADIVFFGHNIIDEYGRIQTTWCPASMQLSAPLGFHEIRYGTIARPPGIVFKASLFRQLNGFSDVFRVTAGDNDFYQRATLIGNVAFVDKVVAGYRVWESGSTLKTIATQGWLKEIDIWCDRVRLFAYKTAGYAYPQSLQDDIYLGNLRAGIRVLKQRNGYWAAWCHFYRSRFPYHASKVGLLKLFAHLVLPLKR